MKSNTQRFAYGLILAVALSQGGCAGTHGTKQPDDVAAAWKAAEKRQLSGTVVETMDAGGYTYICLEKDGARTWAAVPTMKVTVGEELALMPGAEMGPFTSKALDRTFEQLIFSGGPAGKPSAPPAGMPAGMTGMPPGHPSMPGAAGQEKAASAGERTAQPGKLLYSGKVVETMNAGGYTYILLEKDGVRSWAAIALAQVNVGDEIELLPGNEMGSFTSKSLNRTFDNIIFSQGIVPKK
jgi:hypothetical protein